MSNNDDKNQNHLVDQEDHEAEEDLDALLGTTTTTQKQQKNVSIPKGKNEWSIDT